MDGIETHDCFTTSEYMAIDHFGITKPGESWKAVEDGTIETGGRAPIGGSGTTSVSFIVGMQLRARTLPAGAARCAATAGCAPIQRAR